MRIAVFGGSFNPLHNGHAMLADTIIKDLGYDKVLFVPTFSPPHKKINTDIGPGLRLKMLELFCKSEGNGHFAVEACEIERGGISYTVDTLEYLNKKYSDVLEGKLAFIMGDEVASEFDKWNNPDRIAQLANLIIIHRYKVDSLNNNKAQNSAAAVLENTPVGNYKGDFNVPFNKQTFKYPFIEICESILPISSSDIRKRIVDDRSYKYLVPGVVYAFIKDNNLYKTGK